MYIAYRASQSVNDYRVRPQRRPFDRPRSQQANKSESQTPSIEERKSFCIGRIRKSSSAIINSHNGLSFIHGCRLFCPNRRESFTSEEDHTSSRAPAEPKNETAIRPIHLRCCRTPHAARTPGPWVTPTGALSVHRPQLVALRSHQSHLKNTPKRYFGASSSFGMMQYGLSSKRE